MTQPFAVHRLPFTMRSPFTIHRKRVMDNVWKMDNGKWITLSSGGAL